MIFLIISAVILTLVIAILFLPIDASLSFADGFFFKIRFAGIRLFKTEPKEDEGSSSAEDTVSDKKAEDSAENGAKNIFTRLKEEHGFSGAVKIILSFAESALTHIKKLLRHIIIKKVRLTVRVATDNAAKTAVEYGAVCAAAYPVLSLLGSCLKIGYKSIDISSDFNSSEPYFSFSMTARLRVIYLLIAAFKLYGEYRKFSSHYIKERNDD